MDSLVNLCYQSIKNRSIIIKDKATASTLLNILKQENIDEFTTYYPSNGIWFKTWNIFYLITFKYSRNLPQYNMIDTDCSNPAISSLIDVSNHRMDAGLYSISLLSESMENTNYYKPMDEFELSITHSVVLPFYLRICNPMKDVDTYNQLVKLTF